MVGEHLDPSTLRRRLPVPALKRAGLRVLRFHDLRHTFGTIAINRADIVQVQAWMGHADIKTTQRYLHYKARADEAELLSGAFRTAPSQIETPEERARVSVVLPNADPTWTDVAQTILVALQLVVVVAAAIFAWSQLTEARRLREDQTRPFVIVDLDTQIRPFFDLVVKNIGTTMARDVEIRFEPELQSRWIISILASSRCSTTGSPLSRQAKRYGRSSIAALSGSRPTFQTSTKSRSDTKTHGPGRTSRRRCTSTSACTGTGRTSTSTASTRLRRKSKRSGKKSPPGASKQRPEKPPWIRGRRYNGSVHPTIEEARKQVDRHHGRQVQACDRLLEFALDIAQPWKGPRDRPRPRWASRGDLRSNDNDLLVRRRAHPHRVR